MTLSVSAAPGLRFGPLEFSPPVVLAPMAGVTNAPFRTLCRRFGGGVFVGEMVSARGLSYSDNRSWELTKFSDEESPRSLQLYAVDPADVKVAVERLVGEDRIDHLDLNFGCPAPKITRKGGGAAIPLKPRLLASIVRAAVAAAGPVPVTMKFRTGVDDHLLTYLDAGRIGEEEGCAAVALHARTAAQRYDGFADWDAIAALKAHVRSIPVLGNGDIWEAHDALEMMARTGCDGVVIGRGCLGRPWLFRDLNAAFSGIPVPDHPRFGEVREVMFTHAAMLIDWRGEARAMQDFRKHVSWYVKGYEGGRAVRSRLSEILAFDDLRRLVDDIDPDAEVWVDAVRAPRAKRGGRQRVALPDGYLDDLDDDTPPGEDAADASSGG